MANGSNSGITFAKIRSGNGKWVLDNQTNLSEIRTLQSVLFFAGYWSGKGDTRNGYYNAQTVSAVKGFQVIKNISPANGEFNQTTLKALESWSGTLTATRSTTPAILYIRRGTQYAQVGDSGSAITTIRRLLNNKGYTCNSSGAFDSTLEGVVKNFQRDCGFTASGSVRQLTIAALENTVSDTGWLSNGTVKLTAGLLARCGFEASLANSEIVTKLNNALNTYGINTKQKVRHFLAQCMAETQFGQYPMETGYQVGIGDPTSDYSPYCGAGFIHLTHEDTYREFATEIGDLSIIQTPTYATVKVAINYPGTSAGWFWRDYKEINTGTDWNATDKTICAKLTRDILGQNASDSSISTRYGYFTNKICPVLK